MTGGCSRALMGTWIEITKLNHKKITMIRRALMGTWIEIIPIMSRSRKSAVVPSWARGLKSG